MVSEGSGNIGLLDVGIDVVVIAIFDLFIVWLAFKSRLPADKVKSHVNEPVYEVQSGEIDEDDVK